MAKYTAELGEIIQSVDIFDFDYPIYQDSHKAELEQRIIERYYFREIGFETVGRFKHYLKVKMQEIMPIYNEMFRVIDINNINILSNQSLNVNDTNVNTFSSNTTQNEESNDKTLIADTPQGTTDITSGANVSSINKNTGNNVISSTGATRNDSAHNGTNKGYVNITEAELLKKYKENMQDIDDLIIEDLNELFMQIY